MCRCAQQSLQGPPPHWVCGSCHSASPGETQCMCTGQTMLRQAAKELPALTPTPQRLLPFHLAHARFEFSCWLFLILQRPVLARHQAPSDLKPSSLRTALSTASSLHPLCSACHVPPAYLLSSITSAGTDGPKVLLLPLLSNLVHLPIIIACGLICGGMGRAQLHGLALAPSSLRAGWCSEQEPLAPI